MNICMNRGMYRKSFFNVVRMVRQIGRVGWESFTNSFMSLAIPGICSMDDVKFEAYNMHIK